MRKLFFTVLALVSAMIISAQQSNEYKQWDDGKINTSDFQMKVKIPESTPSYAHYFIDLESLSGFKIYKNNYNSFVKTKMLKNASWLDTTIDNVEHQLRMQQLSFDLMEVYARKIRKSLIENKKEMLKGNNKTEHLLEQLRNDHAKTLSLMESETEGGLNIEAVEKWEELVATLLIELHLFRYDYQGKIKNENSQKGVQ